MKRTLLTFVALMAVLVVTGQSCDNSKTTATAVKAPATNGAADESVTTVNDEVSEPVVGSQNVSVGVTILPADAGDESDDVVEDTTIENLSVGEVKSFDVIARKYEFVPETITVNKGDTVKMAITSEDVDHGFSLPEFGVSENLAAGETTNIEFVADQTGTFSFFCNTFCGSGHGSMKGTLVVE